MIHYCCLFASFILLFTVLLHPWYVKTRVPQEHSVNQITSNETSVRHDALDLEMGT